MQGITRRIKTILLSAIRSDLNIFGDYKSAIRVIPASSNLLAEASSYIIVGESSVSMDSIKFNNFFSNFSTLSYIVPHGLINLPQITSVQDSEILDFVTPRLNAGLIELSHYTGFYQIYGNDASVVINYFPLYTYTQTLDGYSKVITIPSTHICWPYADTSSIFVHSIKGRSNILSILGNNIILDSSCNGDMTVEYTTTKFNFDSIVSASSYTLPTYYDSIYKVYELNSLTRDENIYLSDSIFDANDCIFMALDTVCRPKFLDISGYIWRDTFTYTGAGAYNYTQSIYYEYLNTIVSLGGRLLRSTDSYSFSNGLLTFTYDVLGTSIHCVGTTVDDRIVNGYLSPDYEGEDTFLLDGLTTIISVTKNGTVYTDYTIVGSNIVLGTPLYSGDNIQVLYNGHWTKYIAGSTSSKMDLSSIVSSITEVYVDSILVSKYPEYTVTPSGITVINIPEFVGESLNIDYGVWDSDLGDSYIGVIVEIPESLLILQDYNTYYIGSDYADYTVDDDIITDLPNPCLIRGFGNNPIKSYSGTDISEEYEMQNLVPNTGLLFRTRGGSSIIKVMDNFENVDVYGGTYTGTVTIEVVSQDAYTSNVVTTTLGDWLLGDGRIKLQEMGLLITDTSYGLPEIEEPGVGNTRYKASIELNFDSGWMQYRPEMVPLYSATITDPPVRPDGKTGWILPKAGINFGD